MSTLLTSTAPISTDHQKTPCFFSKPSNLSILRKQKQTHHCVAPKIISCKTTNNDGDEPKTTSPKLDRRNVLIGGLGSGLYGAASATLGGAPTSLAAPLQPDLTTCFLSDYKSSGEAAREQCCPTLLLSASEIKTWNPKDYPSPLRTRPSAHTMDPVKVAMFREAMYRMKNLPETDPRSFAQQANVHCAYCDGAYRQVGNPGLDFKVHKSWLFFPFHRCYLYFFERILGKLIDDENFAIPFWNWDHPQGMTMPTIYTQQSLGLSKDYNIDVTNPLYDPLREKQHTLPQTVMDLKYVGSDLKRPVGTLNNLIYDHLCLMKVAMVNPSDAESFMGGKYRAGEGTLNSKGTLERGPHDQIHRWCGDTTQPYNKNMGAFFSAGRDPIFYCHHGNVDRMWSVWKTLGEERKDFSDPDWLDTYFVFYDENAQPVKIYVKDCLDTENLGYKYEDIETPWVDPSTYAGPLSQITESLSTAALVPVEGLPKPLGEGFRLRKVKRPRPPTSGGTNQELLLVDMSLSREDVFVKFDVYVDYYKDDPQESAQLPCASYAATFTNLPERPTQRGGLQTSIKYNLRVPLTAVLKNINAQAQEFLDVIFVPQAGSDTVTITNARIEFI